MKITDILEARKNPEINVKNSINDEIIRRLEQTTETIANVPNFFVSFTKKDKLGINPTSEYSTPIGIFSYPGDYVSNKIGKSQNAKVLPFAGESEFANLFSVKGNILNLKDITDDELSKYIEKLKKVLNSQDKLRISSQTIDDIVTRAPKEARIKTPGGKFWFITWQIANSLSNGSAPIIWNKLFRLIGIDGLVDHGDGIIHSNEPTQAVFFSINSLTNNKRIYNKYSTDDILSGKEYRDFELRLKPAIKNIINRETNFQELYDYLKSYGFKYINQIDNKKIIENLIEQYPDLIKFRKNPSKLEQLIALRSKSFDPRLIFTLSNINQGLRVKYIITHPEIIRSNNHDLINYIALNDLPTELQNIIAINAPELLMYTSSPKSISPDAVNAAILLLKNQRRMDKAHQMMKKFKITS